MAIALEHLKGCYREMQSACLVKSSCGWTMLRNMFVDIPVWRRLQASLGGCDPPYASYNAQFHEMMILTKSPVRS